MSTESLELSSGESTGYTAVPAYKSSLAVAKGACNQTKLAKMSTESLELSSRVTRGWPTARESG
eukprot:1161419-Pelagomonas_calceolata.AAC.1